MTWFATPVPMFTASVYDSLNWVWDLHYDQLSVGQIFITVRQFRICWCGALSLTRGRACSLQLHMALARAVIFRSESRGTRDHILLPQSRDFHFRRLLRLAGWRWRYSTPPPHGKLAELPNELSFITWCGPEREHSLEPFICWIRLLHPLSRKITFTEGLSSNGCASVVDSAMLGNIFNEALPINGRLFCVIVGP
jgi:hypothetical protein